MRGVFVGGWGLPRWGEQREGRSDPMEVREGMDGGGWEGEEAYAMSVDDPT